MLTEMKLFNGNKRHKMKVKISLPLIPGPPLKITAFIYKFMSSSAFVSLGSYFCNSKLYANVSLS